MQKMGGGMLKQKMWRKPGPGGSTGRNVMEREPTHLADPRSLGDKNTGNEGRENPELLLTVS